MSRVAIVGVGGIYPGAPSPEALWELICAGRDASREVPPGRWLLPPAAVLDPSGPHPDRVTSVRGYFLDPFVCDPEGLDLDPALLRDLDPLFHLTLHAGRQAWQAGVTAHLDRQRVGVVLANIALPTEHASALARRTLGRTFAEKAGWEELPAPAHPLDAHVAGLPAGLLAQALGLGGGSFGLDAACASSLYAVKLAADELLAGRADAMLAGGVSRPDCLYTQMGFSQLRALSPSGRCSPFSAAADGLVVGEGAGVFLLKRLEDAVRDGDHVWGVLAGAGLANDVEGGLLAPASEGQLRAMRAAYAAAGWSPGEVDLIECHATGTPVGDAVEFRSLVSLWEGVRRPAGSCVIGSVKSSVGHLLTGAGAAALTKVLFALRDGVLPPTANFERPPRGVELERSPFRVLRRAEPWPRRGGPRRAGVSGFGFGGINAHLLVEEFTGQARNEEGKARNEEGGAIAVVSLAASFGPWSSLEAFRRRVLDGTPAEPALPQRWWGVERSDWFRREGQSVPPGYYLDAVEVPAARCRIPPREAEEMLPQQALMLRVAAEALDRARLGDDRTRVGVFVGVALDLNTTNYHFRWSVLARDPALADAASQPLNANRTMGALASIAASRIARAFRLGGPSFTLSGEESSGLRAVEQAVRALQRGEIDAALAGAVDLAGDVRAVLASRPAIVGEGAGAVVLKRLEDALRDGDAVHAVIRGAASGLEVSAEATIGAAGAASGMASLLCACLALEHRLLPAGRGPWLRDRADGPRCAGVRSPGADGSFVRVVLEESPAPRPLAARPQSEGLFLVSGDNAGALVQGLADLARHAQAGSAPSLARTWWRKRGGERGRLTVALVADDRAELVRLVNQARSALLRDPDGVLPGPHVGLRDRVFYSPSPLGPTGEVALVYPGSGNDFPGMGRDVALAWPGALERQDAENERLASQYLPQVFWGNDPGTPSVKERIFAQVAVGSLVTDVLLDLGVRPQAAVGYSLGESAALFALRAWPDRDAMWRNMNESSLFVHDLAGRLDAAREHWRIPPGERVSWLSGIVERPPGEVRPVCAGLERVYLQIVNTPRECVIGGEPAGVREAVRRLGCSLLPVPPTTTMHCPVVDAVGSAYRRMHHLPTRPPGGVRFYSAGLGRSYDLSANAAADALLAQAVGTADFAAVVEAAYKDGVRLFVEVGPGSSCTRMIAATLGDRPHRARAACVAGADGPGGVLRVLALLAAEGVTVDLSALSGGEEERAEEAVPGVVVPVGGGEFRLPERECSPPLRGGEKNRRGAAGYIPDLVLQVQQTTTAAEARGAAHAAYFRVSAARQQTLSATLAFQGALLEAMMGEEKQRGLRLPRNEETCAPFLDRPGCLTFAVGRIADVLGPDFAAIDQFPIRVRLPDEPLMLVDRILAVEGEPRALTHGRVVTQHDVRHGAWYLDAGRIPTCIAVEAGQADLFLSGYLGIDLRTRGLAVYRLLDAAVTFHRELPGPGATIEYDIHIDQFFRQGDTHLFRFRFVGSVGGQPLLTMTDGCAGFFTEGELAAGKGVVQTELARRPRAGVAPEGEEFLPPMDVERLGEAQVDALRCGDLVGCFGQPFAGLALREPLSLPGGRMRLVHRVTAIEPDGGKFGVGLIRAEADVHPDDWFLTCHFVDDQVMPGTLMYECCLHTLRIFLTRRGWVGEREAVAWEPVPGVTSRLKCRGQVTAATRVVTYEVTVKELGYRPEPYAIVDALMYADGKAIVDIADMSIQLTGQSRRGLRALWEGPRFAAGAARATAHHRPALYDRERILAFAVGNPSEAFGEPYRVFDSQRVIARLPGPPYAFLDRIVAVEGEPWKLSSGAAAEAEYDVPADAWYFAAARQPVMPFAVLLEVALQPCGWLAAYLGSALTSPTDLRFRNLGGDAELIRPVTPASGTLTTRVQLTRVSSSAGMIIQDFTLDVRDDHGPVYRGTTTFGFFSREALAQQVGLRDARPDEPPPNAVCLDFPSAAPFPDSMLRMIDRVDLLVPDGGPAGLGLVRGSKDVDPGEWFFAAHFYQDPVCPGSLGLESLLQLVQFAAVRRWGPEGRFVANLGRHGWTYRGQVIPSNKAVTVQAVVTGVDEAARELTADGLLAVDGLTIYRMNDFRVRVDPN